MAEFDETEVQGLEGVVDELSAVGLNLVLSGLLPSVGFPNK
jgi:hypothetical protein